MAKLRARERFYMPGWRGRGGGRPEDRAIIRSEEEYQLFRRRYGKYPRFLIDPRRTQLGSAPPRLLSDVLSRQVAWLVRRNRGGWSGVVVAVARGDGMTWSAAAADDVVSRSAPFPRHQVVPEPRLDGLPRIVELIPKRRLIDLAQEVDAVPPLPALRRRLVVALIVLLLVLGAAIAALKTLTQAAGGIGLVVPIVGAAGAALLFVSQEVSARLKRSEREADERKLVDSLALTHEERPDAWNALVEALSQELERTQRDRAVIVDDFDRLDALTRETLRHYLTHRSRPAHAHELWVVFEDAGLGTLSNEIHFARLQARRSRPVHMALLRQMSLGDRARDSLAREVGRPERADFHLVKSIVGGELDTADYFGELFEGRRAAQRADARPYGPLEVTYLLAVQHRTGAWGFREQELVSDLSSGSSTAHGEVLRLLLPRATFNRSEVEGVVVRIKDDLPDALDVDRIAAGEVELVREAAEVLVERRSQYDLPANDIVHLFWALYWYSKLGGASDVDAYRLRKLARHLVRAVAPGALGMGLGEGVERRFREALIWTARALLAASLPDDVPKLLLRAAREMDASEDRSWLRSVCWQAYAVLGDEDLLAIILELHPNPASTAEVADPELLFVESLRFMDQRAAPRQELASRLLTLDREILAYAQARGLWLSLTLNFANSGACPRFLRVSAAAASQAAALIGQSLALLQDPTRPRAAIAAQTASIATWCYAVGFRRTGHGVGEANDLLEDVRLHAEQLHDALDEQRCQGGGEDYVLRAFAQELEVTAGAAALLIENAPVSTMPSDEELARLKDHIDGALSGVRPGFGGATESMGRRLDLQALTWRTLGSSDEKPLGFDHLAGFMTLRRVELLTIVDRDREPVERVLSEFAGQLHEPGVIGLMANAVATRVSPGEELAAHFCTRAAELGLVSGLGTDLEAELCFAALTYSHSFPSVAKRRIATRLIDDGPALDAHLAKLDDETRGQASLWLLNAAREDEVEPGLIEALQFATRAMLDHTENEVARDEIRQQLELFELDRGGVDGAEFGAHTLARWEHRRESPHYPWMLHLLVRLPGVDREVLGEAVEYLRGHAEPSAGPSQVSLAYDLASLAGQYALAFPDEYRRVALDYLDRAHPAVESSLPIEMNLAILHLLLRRSVGDRVRHLKARERWEIARQERDALHKLPDLVEAGKFFLVIWHYYETLAFFGLPTHPEIDPGEIAVDGERRVLAEWRARGEPVPDAMVSISKGQALSADFLRYGRALFGRVAENPDLGDARGMFNEAALDAMHGFFDEMSRLDSLPERVRTLLRSHQAQLFRTVGI